MSTDLLQVSLLGPAELSLGPQRLQLPATRKALGLLAYLLLNRSLSQPRDRLAALFWGDRGDEKARGSLSTALWQISHSLPSKECILGEAFSVQFNPQLEVWLDVEEFERLAGGEGIEPLLAAVRLYRGDFLEGFYDNWALQERYRLETLYLDALERLMIRYEAGGAARQALVIAQRLLEKDSLCEDAHRCAMRCFMTLGQRSAALDQYARCKAVLQDELRVEPLPATTQLYQDLLHNRWQPETREAAQPIHGDLALGLRPGGYDPLAVNTTPPCRGREAELQALQAAWNDKDAGESRLVLVSGEAGVGKTRLVRQFMDSLRWRNIPVLAGNCYEFERRQPYQPVVEALQSALPGGIKVEMEEDAQQAAYFEAVARAISSLAGGDGLLLVIEDLHWAGQSTLELLHTLVRHLAQARVMVLGTLRDDEPAAGGAWGRFKEALLRNGSLREIQLRRLPGAAVEALISELSGRGAEIAPLSRRLFKETDGNPFFLMQVVKALFEHQMVRLVDGVWQGNFEQISRGQFPLPASLGEAILNRFSRLDQGARAAAATAAVIGREFDHKLLRQALGWKEERLLLALDELLRHKLVEETSEARQKDYTFGHPKFQEVIYASLPRQRRMRLHLKIAQSIELLHPHSEEYTGELAHHYFQIHTLEAAWADNAIHYLVKAGDQARLLYANQEACEHYEQALRLLKLRGEYQPAARLQMKLGLSYQNAYQFEQAYQAYKEGFQLWHTPVAGDRAEDKLPLQVLRTNWKPPNNIDPVHALFLSDSLGGALFSGLLAAGPDMELVPDAAARWEVQDGGREYIFHLREGQCWSDGSPLSAYDFEYGAQRFLDPVLGSYQGGLLWDVVGAKAYHQGQLSDFRAVGIQALDALTLRYRLEQPVVDFLFLGTEVPPAPRRVIETYGEAWTQPEHIITNGPFRIQTWQPDLIRLVRNEFYRGDVLGNIGMVELHLFTRGESGPLDLYRADQLDVLNLIFCEPLRDTAQRRFASEFFSFPNLGVNLLELDETQPPFQDQRIRHAFAHAIDKDALCGLVRPGSLFPASGGLISPCMPGHTAGIGLRCDPQRAQSLLAEAGFPGGKGFPLLRCASRIPANDSLPEYLRTQWRSVLGINAEWGDMANTPGMGEQSLPPNLQLYLTIADYPDPYCLLHRADREYRNSPEFLAYTKLIEQTRLCRDQTQRLALFRQADRMLTESALFIPLGYKRQHLLIKAWVKHYPVSVSYTWHWKDVVIAPH